MTGVAAHSIQTRDTIGPESLSVGAFDTVDIPQVLTVSKEPDQDGYYANERLTDDSVDGGVMDASAKIKIQRGRQSATAVAAWTQYRRKAIPLDYEDEGPSSFVSGELPEDDFEQDGDRKQSFKFPDSKAWPRPPQSQGDTPTAPIHKSWLGEESDGTKSLWCAVGLKPSGQQATNNPDKSTFEASALVLITPPED